MLLYWIWFAQLKNLSLWQKQKLLEAFSDPEEIFCTVPEAFAGIAGMDAAALAAMEDKDLEESRKILQLCRQKEIGILTCKDQAYPVRLKNIEDAPVVLYYKGILPDWDALPIIGVVGTRKASAYGMHTAFTMSAQIAACGGLVITGGADGIDTAALEGTLAAGKQAVAVFGGGVDVIYPKKNERLFDRVAQNGCLLSEYPPQEKTLGWHFPVRNRIISGISNGVLVVEAPERSGALNTAEHAFRQGRDVFTVPGNLGVDSCVGSNQLLQEGAYPILNGWDAVKHYEFLYPGKVENRPAPLLEKIHSAPQKVAQKEANLGNSPEKSEKAPKKSIDNRNDSTYSVLNKRQASLSQEEIAILQLLGDEPQFPDGVMAQSDLPAGTVQSILTRLTLKGFVKTYPGGRISRK